MSCARCCSAATCEALAFSGTVTSTWARLMSWAPGALAPPRWSRRNWSTSASVTLTLDSSSRSRNRVSSSWLRTFVRNSSRERPAWAMRCCSSATLRLFCRATTATPWSTAVSSTRTPCSLASCSCAFSEMSCSSTCLASWARGMRSISGPPSCSTRSMRFCTSVLVMGSELTSATMNSAARWACGAAGGRALAGGTATEGPARMMSVMPIGRCERCCCARWVWATAVVASAAAQASARVERRKFMAMSLLGRTQS